MTGLNPERLDALNSNRARVSAGGDSLPASFEATTRPLREHDVLVGEARVSPIE